MEFVPAPNRLEPPGAEAHVWLADLDEPRWPGAAELPADERERAESFLRPLPRRRWIAARWALREVLSRYLGQPPAAIRLTSGEHGKPRLAGEDELRFNLSHSDRLALVATASGREVGVDVELIDLDAHPRDFYAGWTEREARVKCLGTGLTGPEPAQEPPIAMARIDLGRDFAAAVAVAGPPPTLRGWTFGPTAPVERNPG